MCIYGKKGKKGKDEEKKNMGGLAVSNLLYWIVEGRLDRYVYDTRGPSWRPYAGALKHPKSTKHFFLEHLLRRAPVHFPYSQYATHVHELISPVYYYHCYYYYLVLHYVIGKLRVRQGWHGHMLNLHL